MSYLDELKNELRELLGDLDEEQREAVLKWVLKQVYQSYKNGKEYTKVKAVVGRAEKEIKKAGKKFVKKSEDDD